MPDEDFERFERIAKRHGMNRSEFYRRGAQKLADELQDEAELTRRANEDIEQNGQPSDDFDGDFLQESQRNMLKVEW